MTPAWHRHDLTVPERAMDANGHANNVEYLRWMQDAAIAHANASDCSRLTTAAGASWVVRSHHVEYLRSVFAGDKVTVITWISTMQQVRSLRKYLLFKDGVPVARGETLWVFIDASSGRPRAVPGDIRAVFTIIPAEEEPSGWLDAFSG